MTCANNLTIKMNNKAAATAAMATIKNVLATTSIKEPREGNFAEIADWLMVKKNTISGLAGMWVDTWELLIPEILKALAAQGNKFSGDNHWSSDYDSEYYQLHTAGFLNVWRTAGKGNHSVHRPKTGYCGRPVWHPWREV